MALGSVMGSVMKAGVAGLAPGSSNLLVSATDYLNGIAPHHWWDFVNNRALFAGINKGALSNTPGWSFARASTGYYTNSDGTLASFASGALRRGDRGVLIEGERTNLCLQSQTFNTSWTATGGGSVTANAASAPDGTTTADLRTEPASGTPAIRPTDAIAVASATAHTLSIYVKRVAELQWIRLIAANNTTATNRAEAWFDIQNGVVGTVTTGGTGWTAQGATIRALANGWHRLTLSLTTGATTCYPFIHSAASDASTTRVANSQYLLWGAQLEAAGFASSYIPTTTVSAAREADILTVSTPGVDYPLSLWVEAEREVDTGGVEHLFSVDDGDASDRARLAVDASDRLEALMTTGSSDVAQIPVTGAIALRTTFKGAGRFQTNDTISARDGTLGTQDTSCTAPATPTTIRIGAGASGANPAFGYIHRAAIFNSALSDADLQTATT